MNEPKVGEVWYVDFPFRETNDSKKRPAFILDNKRVAVLAAEITSVNKPFDPYRIEILDWKEAGLRTRSFVKIDCIDNIDELNVFYRIGTLSERDKIKAFQLIVDFHYEKPHDFSLVAIRSENKFLQRYNESWSSWLFPFFRTDKEDNKSHIDAQISKMFGEKLYTTFLKSAVHCKFSQKDLHYKVYNHMLYEYKPQCLPNHMNSEYFEIDGEKYKWMTIEEMIMDDRIAEVNSDIISFVKTYCK